jgi:hypothetical protein
MAHVDPTKLQMAERLPGCEPEQLNPERELGPVPCTGKPEL